MIHTICLAAALFAQTSVAVAGRVLADDATRARVIRVALTNRASAEVLSTLVDSDGSFEFSKVPPGSYTAIAFAATSVSQPVTLAVGAADINDVQIRLPEPKTIRGRIAVQGNVPGNIPMPRVAFSLAPIAGIPASSATVPPNLEPDGSFTIGLPEGERRISIVPGTVPPGYKIASLTYGTTDLLKDPLRIAAGDNAELRVTFDASTIAAVKVSGRVTDLLNTQGVRVVLTHQLLGSVEAPVSADGSFAFSNVMPGSYIARLSLSGLSTATQVAVADRDVTDLMLRYPREFIVAGHVIVEGDAVASPSLVLEARDAKTAGAAPRTAASINNLVMLNLKDGEYNVALRSVPAGYALQSVKYGTTDLQKAPLKIDGPVTWEIIVRLVPSSR
jgi:hypothetical protein